MAMPENSIQVPSPKSLATSPSPLHCLSYRFGDPSRAFGAPLLQGATRMACNTVLSFLFLRIYSHTSEAKSPRLRFR